MKIFKIKTGPCQSYDISKENFEIATNKDEKYINKTGIKTRYFVICPACDNPIILLGMYKTMKDKCKNTGVYQKNNIKGIAVRCSVVATMNQRATVGNNIYG